MTQFSNRERVDAALLGKPVDQVPVSTWRHFIPEESSTDTLAQVSLKHFYDFDWDWLKVNPRATYYAEAWGNRYDYTQYARVYPKRIAGPIQSSADLEKIHEVSPSSAPFAEQIDLIRKIKAGIGQAHLFRRFSRRSPCLPSSPLALSSTPLKRQSRPRQMVRAR